MGRQFEPTFTGGVSFNGTVDDSGTTLISAENPLRSYLLFRNMSGTETMYLHLNTDGPAVYGSGIPIRPYEFYEIGTTNMYVGNVWAVVNTGVTVTYSAFAGV